MTPLPEPAHAKDWQHAMFTAEQMYKYAADETARLNSGWYDKLLAATLERDALRKDYALLDEVFEQMISGAVSMLDIARDADRLTAENAAQRKVLVQARDALIFMASLYTDRTDPTLEAPIAAIQEQLNEHN